jgi:hypothetical protein
VMKSASDASRSSSVRVTRPEGSVEVSTGEKAPRTTIDVAIDPPIDPIKQKTPKVCWAAAGTMMLAWKRRASLTVEAALDSIGGGWRAKYDQDKALVASDLRDFASALGLKEEGAASYTPQGLANLVAEHGPLWVITDDAFGPGNRLVHIRIVTAVRGDGTPAGSTVVLVDSASGMAAPEAFTDFAARLEAAEPVSFGTGVFHF